VEEVRHEGMDGLERTHYCGEVLPADRDRTVTVMGWVHRRRDHGGLVFVDLRDRTGLVQVVVSPSAGAAFDVAEASRPEWVLAVTGQVRLRPEGMANPDMATGAVEVVGQHLRVLARSDTPPISPADTRLADETVRLQHRYLDLRRPGLLANFVLRDRVVFAVRSWMHRHGFLDVETPALGKSTPEGARDFLVPSRIRPGMVYALPQSPQTLKQLLMVGGFDRYYQIVKVFRDEALRADRQPEFTQIDVEMSFLSQARILALMEDMVTCVFRETMGVDLAPWPRLTHADALRLYGTDKPDLRAGPPLADVTDAARPHAAIALPDGSRWVGVVLADAVPSRRQLDGWVDRARELGAPGLFWLRRDGGVVRTNAGRALADGAGAAILEAAGVGAGGVLLVVAGEAPDVYRWAGQLRLDVSREVGGGRGDAGDRFRFLWVTDFPLFEWSEEEGRWTSAHHPFTMPHPDDLGSFDSHPATARSQAYDVVLNGVELASGSLRIYDAELQARVFGVLGLSRAAVEDKFGYLLNAFRYGAPPHGGIAFGLDRLVMLMAGAQSLRDVIAFPKTNTGSDPLMGAPAPADPAQWAELGLRPVAAPEGQER
jgi:aspartyl-tRNA synthetase